MGGTRAKIVWLSSTVFISDLIVLKTNRSILEDNQKMDKIHSTKTMSSYVGNQVASLSNAARVGDCRTAIKNDSFVLYVKQSLQIIVHNQYFTLLIHSTYTIKGVAIILLQSSRIMAARGENQINQYCNNNFNMGRLASVVDDNKHNLMSAR